MTTTEAIGTATGRRGVWRQRLEAVLLSEYLVLALTVVYVLALWPFVPEILSSTTVVDVVVAMLPLLVVAIGQTFVLIIAGIDLSATAIIAMASVVGASIMTGSGGYLAGSPLAVPVGILAFIAVGGLIGLFNGLCVTRFAMPPFIVTLTTMMFVSGGAIWFTTFHTESSSIGNLPTVFTMLGRGTVAGVPIALLVALAVGIGAHLLLSRTVFGRWLFAIGINPKAAAISGVPVGRVVLLAFVLSALCAALASILYTGRLETGTPVLGQRILLDIIGAAVIGGVSLFGGKGKVLWVLFGVLFLTTIDKGLALLGLSLFTVLAVKGAVILLAAVIDALRHRLLARG